MLFDDRFVSSIQSGSGTVSFAPALWVPAMLGAIAR
jgi:hypothetical protein